MSDSIAQCREAFEPVLVWLRANRDELASLASLTTILFGSITFALTVRRWLRDRPRPEPVVPLTRVHGPSPVPAPRPGRRRWIVVAFVLFLVAGAALISVRALDSRAVEARPAAEPGPEWPTGLAFAPVPGTPLHATATEVTQAEFLREFPNYVPHFSRAGPGRAELRPGEVGDDLPVDASARDAEAYCAKLTAEARPGVAYRLPTRAEFAALAAGPRVPEAGVVSPSRFKVLTRPAPVGVAGTGFRHLVGNVAEWVIDGDGVAAAGGSYLDTAGDCRLVVPYARGDRRCHVGFRVVREVVGR